MQSWSYSPGGTPANGDLKSEFSYDGIGRLRKRLEYHWQASGGGDCCQRPEGQQLESLISTDAPTGSWILDSETRYIYDGKRVIQERDGSNTPLVSYTRGRDLSRSLEGAGGIGGLLARSSGTSGTWTTHSTYFADGNGNVTYMLNSSQAMVASYRYDPFGNAISKSGSLADANVYRFSSKEIHTPSGFYYYLYRFYDPNLQTWINRDPLASGRISADSTERMDNVVGPFELSNGGNLYNYVYNNPVNQIDPFGLDVWIIKSCSWPGHEWIVGNNPDGTYWDSNFHPDTKSGWGLNCKGKTDFNDKSGFDPYNLGDPCLSVVKHIKTSPSVDAKVKAEAKRRNQNPKQPRYDALGNNCRDYCNGMGWYARGAQWRENMDKK